MIAQRKKEFWSLSFGIDYSAYQDYSYITEEIKKLVKLKYYITKSEEIISTDSYRLRHLNSQNLYTKSTMTNSVILIMIRLSTNDE